MLGLHCASSTRPKGQQASISYDDERSQSTFRGWDARHGSLSLCSNTDHNNQKNPLAEATDSSHSLLPLCPPQVAHLLAVCSCEMALESRGLAAAHRPAWRSTVQQHLVATALTAYPAPEALLAAIVDADELKQVLACACGVVQQPRARREEAVNRTERKAHTRSSDLNAMLCTSSADST